MLGGVSKCLLEVRVKDVGGLLTVVVVAGGFVVGVGGATDASDD